MTLSLGCPLGLGVVGIALSLLENGIQSSLDITSLVSRVESEDGTSSIVVFSSTSGSSIASVMGLEFRGGEEGGKSRDFQSKCALGLGVVGVKGRLNTKSSSLAIGKLFD